MIRIELTGRSGETVNLETAPGLTLMEALRDNGVDELLALCGGCCSCATCHVFIDHFEGEPFSDVGEDENDLLDSSNSRTGASRLSCQLPLTAAVRQLRVTLAPED